MKTNLKYKFNNYTLLCVEEKEILRSLYIVSRIYTNGSGSMKWSHAILREFFILFLFFHNFYHYYYYVNNVVIFIILLLLYYLQYLTLR